MQTFMPYGQDFDATARSLDGKRLNKQLLEARQIMSVLVGESEGWRHHPAVKQFIGHNRTLMQYSFAIAKEMKRRGYKWQNNYTALYSSYLKSDDAGTIPGWLSDDRLSYTHKGMLHQKAPELYPQFAEFADFRRFVCCEKCNYWWPTHEMRNNAISR